MPRGNPSTSSPSKSPGANLKGSGFQGHLGFEVTLRATAEQAVPAPNFCAAEYNGGRAPALGLGLIFLKHISDAFEAKHAALQKEKGADPEDCDEYVTETRSESRTLAALLPKLLSGEIRVGRGLHGRHGREGLSDG